MVVSVSHTFFRPELNAFLMSVCSSDADSCNTETVFCESELVGTIMACGLVEVISH